MRWRRHLGWHPGDLVWRIAVLFMVGSFLFALGSFPPFAQGVDPNVVGAVFFVGSLFFTSAAYSQFLQTVNDDRAPGERFRFWGWQPDSKLWWAGAVQLLGTLFFNVNTFRAMTGDYSGAAETNQLVWAPDFFGSICFLIASHLAWLVACGRLWCVKRDDADWWGAALNYTGSIFFFLAALGAFTLPTTGEAVNITMVNVGTFAGAVCFFVGAYLLLPPAPVREAGRSEPATGS